MDAVSEGCLNIVEILEGGMVDRAVIHLDTNKWIDLADQRGTDQSSTDRETTLDLLKTATKRNKVIVPVSLQSLIEVASYDDPATRQRTFELMLDLSDLWAFALYPIVEREEALAYVDDHQEQTRDVQDQILGQGISHIIVGPDRGVLAGNSPFTPAYEQFINQMMDTQAGFEIILSDMGIRKELADRTHEEELARRLEPIRERKLENADSAERYCRKMVVSHYSTHVDHIVREVCKSRGLDTQFIGANFGAYWMQRDGNAAEEAAEFFQGFPSMYSYVMLTSARDTLERRTIESNDYNDIFALSVAIPYADLVVTEGFFHDQAQRCNLPDLYDTTVTTDLSDVDTVLT